MSSVEFIAFSLENWPILLCWCLVIPIILGKIFIKLSPAGLYDPLLFYIGFNCGTAYGVVISLYQTGYISDRIFLMVLGYSVVFYVSLYLFLKIRHRFTIGLFKKIFCPTGTGKAEFYFIIFMYAVFSIIILSLSGFGALTDTNRFEQARGVGVFVRVLDALRLVILAYTALLIWNRKDGLIKRSVRIFLLIFFLLFSSLLGGAKFGLLEGLYAVAVAISAIGIKIKLNIVKGFAIAAFATLFALLILQLNQRNSDGDVVIYGANRNPVIDGLISRILSNGDTYYEGLPNDVIDKIRTDNVFVRFLSPILGVSQVSKIVGYPVEDYSVGRATLLYHDPQNAISGGPVSHFDLFSYVFLGYFGVLFVLFITYLLSVIVEALKTAPDNYLYIAILSALWLRALPSILEPPVGIAYVIDLVIIFSVIKFFSLFFRWTFKLQ